MTRFHKTCAMIVEMTEIFSFFFFGRNRRMTRSRVSAENRKSYVEIRWIMLSSPSPSVSPRKSRTIPNGDAAVGGEERRFDRLPVVTRN